MILKMRLNWKMINKQKIILYHDFEDELEREEGEIGKENDLVILDLAYTFLFTIFLWEYMK